MAVASILAAPAFAGPAERPSGYVVTQATGRLESRPPAAVRIDGPARVPLPFRFAYYGRRADVVFVSPHGWLLPGARDGFAAAEMPSAAHGQDPASGAFPYSAGSAASADGVIAPLWTSLAAAARDSGATTDRATPARGGVWSWTSGAAPERRFVVAWEDVALADGRRATFQAQLHEGAGRIVFAYAPSAVTTGDAATQSAFVCGIDEPAGGRFVAPLAPLAPGATNTALPQADFVFDPRTVLFNDPAGGKVGAPVTWLDSRRESLSGEDGAKSCCYVAKGQGVFFVPDRVTNGVAARTAKLAAEDAATFPAPAGRDQAGDPDRWVRQVLDGKAILIPADPSVNRGEPVRLWFRIVEYFTIDGKGIAGTDTHLWNLRIMLRQAFGADDPRGRIDSYAAWRGTAEARLSVVKLFDAAQPDDAGRQFSTGRINEYLLWCGRLRPGQRGPMPPDDCPRDGWTRFFLLDHDEQATQYADFGKLRAVPDPNYVDGFYEYVIRSDGDPTGWVSRRRARSPAMTEERIDEDPAPR